MPIYTPPLADMRHLLHEVFDAPAACAALPGLEDATADVMEAVLAEAGRLCAEVLFPLNQAGDAEGCRLEDGEVRTPAGFREAYAAFTEGGWTGLACHPEHGGQGLPKVLDILVQEMVSSANLAFSLYPYLTLGAYHAIHAHGTEHLKQACLEPMATGRWTGAMCLTEPHAGTDLGLLRTRATPRDDGTYAVSGTKIFITSGDHDLAENIVHLVLARLPDAPAGVKGISLVAVPKYLFTADGGVGPRNPGFTVGSIEHKMGINGSCTCVMNYDDAVGWLVGTPHRGLAAMFTMMNAERLFVGVQGLAVAETAYQNAAAYAGDRIQGRSPRGTEAADKAADPIIVHPDVRRMLLRSRAFIEAGRALAVWTALHLDRADHHPDAAERHLADGLVALVTPVVKAALSDFGFQACVDCQQVLGGHGYVREWGLEQYVRDSRICQIYEGTNGVQAMDLVNRKLTLEDGQLPHRLFAEIDRFLEAHAGNNAMVEFTRPLAEALDRLRDTTAFITIQAEADPAERGAAAVDYLHQFALTAFAWMWARMAAVSLRANGQGDPAFHAAKLATARFFMRRMLPQTAALAAQIKAGAGPVMALPAAAF